MLFSEGAWYIEVMMGRHHLPLPVAGTIAGGYALLEVDYRTDSAGIWARMEGSRLPPGP